MIDELTPLEEKIANNLWWDNPKISYQEHIKKAREIAKKIDPY